MAVTKLNPFAPEYIPLGTSVRYQPSVGLLDHPHHSHPVLISAFPSPHQILYQSAAAPPPPPPPTAAAACVHQFHTPPPAPVIPVSVAVTCEQERGIVLRRSSGRGRNQSNPRPSPRREIENINGHGIGGPARGGRGVLAGGSIFGEKRWTASRYYNSNENNNNNNNVRVSAPRSNNMSNEISYNNVRVSEQAAPTGDHIDVVGGGGLLKHEVVLLNSEDEKTTVMIKNIPYEYTWEMLLRILDKHCMLENRKSEEEGESLRSAYDFMYLPIDFRRGKNRGYAFVNFTDPRAALKFQPCDLFPDSHKRSLIVCAARIQGLQSLVRHFEKSTFYCEDDEYLPVSFNPPRDGGGGGDADDAGVHLKKFIGTRISPAVRASQQLPNPSIAAGAHLTAQSPTHKP